MTEDKARQSAAVLDIEDDEPKGSTAPKVSTGRKTHTASRAKESPSSPLDLSSDSSDDDYDPELSDGDSLGDIPEEFKKYADISAAAADDDGADADADEDAVGLDDLGLGDDDEDEDEDDDEDEDEDEDNDSTRAMEDADAVCGEQSDKDSDFEVRKRGQFGDDDDDASDVADDLQGLDDDDEDDEGRFKTPYQKMFYRWVAHHVYKFYTRYDDIMNNTLRTNPEAMRKFKEEVDANISPRVVDPETRAKMVKEAVREQLFREAETRKKLKQYAAAANTMRTLCVKTNKDIGATLYGTQMIQIVGYFMYATSVDVHQLDSLGTNIAKTAKKNAYKCAFTDRPFKTDGPFMANLVRVAYKSKDGTIMQRTFLLSQTATGLLISIMNMNQFDAVIEQHVAKKLDKYGDEFPNNPPDHYVSQYLHGVINNVDYIMDIFNRCRANISHKIKVPDYFEPKKGTEHGPETVE